MTSPATLSAKVYEELRRAVAAGELAPGTPLLEANLAQRWAVSRTPIREALVRIELEGYAGHDERGRLVVRTSTRSEISDWFLIRRLLETYAVRLATERISDPELRELDGLISTDAVALREERADRLAALNEHIHDLIYGASRNRVLVELVRRLRGRVYGISAFAVGGMAEQRAFVEDHAALARHLRAGAAEEAARVIGSHLERARELLEQPPRSDNDTGRDGRDLDASGDDKD
jgi:DNA-binding GntR family transcriptional regulator